MRTRTKVLGISLGLSLVVIPLAGYSAQGDASPQEVTTIADEQETIHGFGYQAFLTPDEHIEALANTEIFSGEVISVGDPIRIAVPGPDGTVSKSVYTPIDVIVSETFRGAVVPKETVRLRFLGGNADGLNIIYEGALTTDEFKRGTQVLVFGGEVVQAGNEPIAALTPNMMAIDEGSMIRIPLQGFAEEHSLNKTDFLKLLRKRT